MKSTFTLKSQSLVCVWLAPNQHNHWLEATWSDFQEIVNRGDKYQWMFLEISWNLTKNISLSSALAPSSGWMIPESPLIFGLLFPLLTLPVAQVTLQKCSLRWGQRPGKESSFQYNDDFPQCFLKGIQIPFFPGWPNHSDLSSQPQPLLQRADQPGARPPARSQGNREGYSENEQL